MKKREKEMSTEPGSIKRILKALQGAILLYAWLGDIFFSTFSPFLGHVPSHNNHPESTGNTLGNANHNLSVGVSKC